MKTEENVEKDPQEIEIEFETLKKEAEDYKDNWLRTTAEYENYRKRAEKEKLSIFSDATAKTISKILPIADSLENALKATQNEAELSGIKLIKNQLNSAFSVLKVEAFGEINDEFNPEIHSAIMHTEDAENKKQNFISEIFQKGYKIGDKIIRHAMVQVTN